MKRRIVALWIILGVAFVMWLAISAPASEYGDGQCQVCGETATFVVADAVEDKTMRFCETHGKEYREREGVPERPE